MRIFSREREPRRARQKNFRRHRLKSSATTGRRALPVSDSTIAANSSGGTARTARIFGRKNRALIGRRARMIAAMFLSCNPAKITVARFSPKTRFHVSARMRAPAGL